MIVATGALMGAQDAGSAASMQNLAQLHNAINIYAVDHGAFPPMSSPADANPRTRWPDHTRPYAKTLEIYTNPLSHKDMINRRWAHDQNLMWGGYGYNFQYLGNSRLNWTAKKSEIAVPGQTVLIADTQGVRKDDGTLGGGVYTIDPPLPSARGTARPSGFYGDGENCGTGPQGCRSTPAEWLVNRVHVLFVDGNAKLISRAQLDDKDGDRKLDNGWFNGSGDAAKL